MQKFNNLAQPFRDERFDIFRRGISDNPSIDVYINEQKDFAFLYPAPSMDYSNYVPRVRKYVLTEYKKGLQVIKRRFDKIEHHLKKDHHSLLEIGAAGGTFLKTVREHRADMHLTAIDQDQNTLPSRVANSDENYDSLAELISNNKDYDIICLFHVLEHILMPVDFLSEILKLMSIHSLLIIEVPSLMDPLLSLYNNEAFSIFFFSSQHPYMYSPSSLLRLMETNGFQTVETIHFQRYGLENHLNWLTQAQPGGNKIFQSIFKDIESEYIAKLEQYGKTDTVIWVGTRGDK